MDGLFGSKPMICFEVQKVIGVSEHGTYRVQWAPAWVSKFHLVGCEHLIQEFLQQQVEMTAEESDHTQRPTGQIFDPLNDEGNNQQHCDVKPDVGTDMDHSHEFDATEPLNFDEGGDEQGNRTTEESLLDAVIIKVEPNLVGEGGESSATSEAFGGIDISECVSRPANVMDDLQSINYAKTLIANAERSDSGYDEGNRTSSKTMTCDICHKSFNCKSRFEVHYRVHTGTKPYQCTFCEKSFNVKGNLVQHERIHTGVKPYHCTHCSYAASVKSQLTVHLRTHTGEKPYPCNTCDKAFTSSSHLKRHQLTHTG